MSGTPRQVRPLVRMALVVATVVASLVVTPLAGVSAAPAAGHVAIGLGAGRG